MLDLGVDRRGQRAMALVLERVDHGHHGDQADARGEAIAGQGPEDRQRLGDPGRLDHDPLDGRLGVEQIGEALGHVLVERAADAPAGELDLASRAGRKQRRVDADRSELVDQDRELSARRLRLGLAMGEQAVQAAWSCRCRGSR